MKKLIVALVCALLNSVALAGTDVAIVNLSQQDMIFNYCYSVATPNYYKCDKSYTASLPNNGKIVVPAISGKQVSVLAARLTTGSFVPFGACRSNIEAEINMLTVSDENGNVVCSAGKIK